MQARANDDPSVGAFTWTPSTRQVATKSSTGLRTSRPRPARKSGWATSARRVVLMSVPESVNAFATAATRASDGSSATKCRHSLVAMRVAVAGWRARYLR